MIAIKYIILFGIFGTTSYIGILMGKRYSNRVKELQEMKNALAMLEAKIKFTYEPLPKAFTEISEKFKGNIGEIFKKASNNMSEKPADISWSEAINEVSTNMKKDDIDALNNMSKLLGKTDLDGQISEIELVNSFLDTQINNAQQEKFKNEKLHKTLRRSNWTCDYHCSILEMINNIKMKGAIDKWI